jgi:hypothetical protein
MQMNELIKYDLIESYLRDIEVDQADLSNIAKLLDVIRSLHLEELPAEERNKILKDMQGFLIDKLSDYNNPQRLEATYDPSKSTWQLICDLLDEARENSKDGPVAHYLVGAMLQVRFPAIEISNESFADVQLGRLGDFYLGNTVIHVTVSPMPALYEKCKRNLRDGLKVYLLVRNKDVVGAKQNAENIAPGQIVIEAIETFVGQNLDELATFSNGRRASGLRQLLETYNRRVDAAEMDKSLMIEIPPNLH